MVLKLEFNLIFETDETKTVLEIQLKLDHTVTRVIYCQSLYQKIYTGQIYSVIITILIQVNILL